MLEPSLRRAEIARAERKAPGRLDAYDLHLRAVPQVLTNKVGGTDEALRPLQAALELDPGLLPPHGYAAWLHEQRYFRGGLDPADRAAALAHAVLGLNADDSHAMSIGAFVRGMLTGDYDAALVVFDRALITNVLDELAERVRQMGDKARSDDIPGSLAEGERFHEIILESSGNIPLQNMVRGLRSQINRYRSAIAEQRKPKTRSEEHRSILKALEKRDAEGAEKAMRHHITQSAQALLSQMRR